MNRRSFMKHAMTAASAGSLLGAGATTSAPSESFNTKPFSIANNRRPNILWIQTDEHRPDSLGCYGSAWAKTPNIDALAARGVRMHCCVCQSPVCVPSRSSQLTCRYPQEINVLLNNEVAWVPDIFPDGTLTFPEVLEQAGYETINFGKSHTPIHPTWQKSLEEKGGYDDTYAGFTEMGSGYNEDEFHVVKRPGIHPIIIGGSFPIFEGNPTMRLTNSSLDYLRDRDATRPFMLRVSYNWPHTPVLPPPPFDRLYQVDEIPIQMPHTDAIACRANYDRTLATAQRMSDLSPDEYRQAWKDYMGLVAYVDYEVGRLLAGLRALGLADNTIVLFTADHGRALGEFGHGEKCTYDRQVWEVPCIWHWPCALPEGDAREDLCELVDTGRTLLGLIGASDRAPATWRGRDIFGASPPPTETQAVFGQIGWPNRHAPLLQTDRVKKAYTQIEDAMGMSVEQAYPIFGYMRVAVRTHDSRMDVTWMQDGKRIAPEHGDGNLFDLRNDPLELTNLWRDPSSQPIVMQLYRRLNDWFDTLDTPALVFGDNA